MNYSKSLISRVFILAVVALGVSVRTCRAELVFSFQDKFLKSGEEGSIDVFIRSTTGSDHVQFANYAFDITFPNTASPGFLQFQPTALQLKTEQSVSSPFPYIFFGDTNSANINAVVQPQTPQAITGFDSTASGNDVTIGTSNLLLARLELKHIGASQSGDFTIRLRNDPGQTFFEDRNGNRATISFASSSFGTVSVSAVPEPSSLVLCAIVIAFTIRHNRRKRTQARWLSISQSFRGARPKIT